MTLKMDFTESDKTADIVLRGSLVENTSALDQLNLKPSQDLRIDLQGLTLISSVGVRHFHTWAASLPCKSITFFKCPPIFLYQLNLVPDFLPSRSHIESFYVPYFSDFAGEEKLVLYTKGAEFEKIDGKVVIRKPNHLDSKGVSMDLDIPNDRFFGFLDRYY